MKNHTYEIKVEWTGNEGNGTLNYKSYNRNHKIIADGKYDGINGSSDLGQANRKVLRKMSVAQPLTETE